MASEESNLCPECGKPVPVHSQHRICPSCLMAQALASRTVPGEGEAAPQQALPDPSEIADKFPQFDISECLGRGGMGVVYKARQKSLNRTVAIKILAPERVHDSRFAPRFAREAELLAQLSHPHIVTIHDFGQADGLFYLLMEYVDGVNLRDLLREGRLEPQQALKIVPSICEALQYAHEKGIVHRDIKPENLLLDRDGRVKIADFGIAGLVGAEGESAGTPPYMAPEQSEAPREVDHRADIYALGVVLYEMLTGERPGKEIVAPSQKVEIDVRLDEVVLRALEKKPEHRYQQVSIFKTQVETIASGTSGASVAEGASAPAGQRRGVFRNRRVSWGLAAACVVFVVLVVTLLNYPRATRHVSLQELARSPHLLRNLPTGRIIEAGLAEPISPWAWQELHDRKLTRADGDKIMDGVTTWLQREYPKGRVEPLSWLDGFLKHLEQSGLVESERKVRMLAALHGDLRPEALPRLREGAEGVDLQIGWRHTWRDDLLGCELMNEVQSVTVNGQPVKPKLNYGKNWNASELSIGVPLPALAPGIHKIKVDVLSVLVGEDAVVGLAGGAPSAEWPPALKRWIRSVEVELPIFGRDAVIVSQTDDPALNPMSTGGLSLKQILIRNKGDQAQAVLSFELTGKLAVSVSFDVAIRVAGQTISCGQLWASKRADGVLDQSGGKELSAELMRLDPQIKTADVLLTPTTGPVESLPNVDRIWGGEIVFDDVPLVRQDLSGGSAAVPQQ